VSSPISAPRPPASDAAGIAAGYDALAGAYDAQLAPAGWVRERLWARLDALFPPGARVLDVTAGTGLDAVHLAGRGVRIVACDVSPAMLGKLRAKEPAIETRLADFNDLGALNGLAGLDGILSTFAGLNTALDLRPFARGAARLLRPGGGLFVHLLNRWPALDLLRQAAGLHARALWQSLVSDRRQVSLGGVPVAHYLYSPLSLYRRVFAADFRLSRVEAQGLLQVVGAAPGWSRRRLARWERSLATRAPFYALGTFFSLELARL
jgi:SAM-dependent methyltransferase